jgi:mono/diheme cytochrome c family protein
MYRLTGVGLSWRPGFSGRFIVPLRQACLAFAAVLAVCIAARAQEPAGALPLTTGREIFLAGCAGCHGADGKGQPQSILGFEPPDTFPDFTDCPTTTPESDIHWKSIITDGGPRRGFSEIMPSFREALTPAQIDMVVEHLRTLCVDESWPRAEMNLPRPLYTEKAFPENETVFNGNVGASGGYAGGNIVYEKRFGARTNVELIMPFSFSRLDSGGTTSWGGGVGDLTVELKRVAYYNLRSGSLLTVAGELNLNTGDRARGTGNGVTIIEPFVSFAQLFPRESFLQVQSGVEFPTSSGVRPKEAFIRTAIGKTFREEQGVDRAWSPMLEILAARDLQAGARTEIDIAPQMQVTLAQRQHVRANFGVRIPVNNFNSRNVELGFYLLWDWFDGGFRDGWHGLPK